MSRAGTRIGAIAQRWNCMWSISLFVLAALFQLIAVSFNASGAEAERPNIVILYADDMGYGDLACQNPDSKEGYPPDAFDWTRTIPGGPLDHGFDDYFGDDVPNFPPYTWFENDRLLASQHRKASGRTIGLAYH